MTDNERNLLQILIDEITSFLLDNVAEDETWEDAYPQLDDLRSHIQELLEDKQ